MYYFSRHIDTNLFLVFREFNEIFVIFAEDVRSLTLPGNYQEKISSLGTSLRGFKRLKKLDISRNNLEVLEVSYVTVL